MERGKTVGDCEATGKSRGKFPGSRLNQTISRQPPQPDTRQPPQPDMGKSVSVGMSKTEDGVDLIVCTFDASDLNDVGIKQTVAGAMNSIRLSLDEKLRQQPGEPQFVVTNCSSLSVSIDGSRMARATMEYGIVALHHTEHRPGAHIQVEIQQVGGNAPLLAEVRPAFAAQLLAEVRSEAARHIHPGLAPADAAAPPEDGAVVSLSSVKAEVLLTDDGRIG